MNGAETRAELIDPAPKAAGLGVEAVYKRKMADLEELKKSILQRAFAGELSIS